MAQLIKIGNTFYSDLRMNGRRIRRSLSKDKRQAQRLLEDLVMIRRAEKYGEVPRHMSWNYFKQKYFAYCASTKSMQTQYRDALAFRMVERAYPIQRLAQMRPSSLEMIKQRWEKEGKTLSVVTRAVKSVKTAMRKAEDWGYIAPQNWRGVKVKEPQSRLIYYSLEEYKRLLEVCRGPWLTAAYLMGKAGLRIGEAYYLETSDLDFGRRLIWIHAKDGWTPKGGRERFIPMSDGLFKYLGGIRMGRRWVLGDDRMTFGSFCSYFKRLIQKADLPGSPHTLRHTFASLLVSGGTSLEKVAGLLGHKNLKTTMIYSHLQPDSLRDAIQHLPE